MPSYRPKSLEELNNMYDKKLAAESAMRNQLKAESKPVDTTPPAYEPYTYDNSKQSKQTEEPVTDISGAVNEFIRTFGQPEEKKTAVQAAVHPVQTRVTSKKIPSGAHAKPTAPAKKKKAATPVKKQERTVLVRNDERSDLMDDYKKIMMDEDEDNLSLKERLAMKKKSKAEKKEADKAAKKAHKKSADETNNVQSDSVDAANEKQSELQNNEQAEDNIVINSEEISSIAESFINEHIGEAPAENEDIAQQDDIVQEEPSTEKYQPEDETEDQYDENIDTYQSQDESDADEDYPEQQDIFESFGNSEKSRNKGRAGRVISMMMLIVMLLLTACTGALKYVVNIDTGKAFMGKYYVFTANERLLYAGINVGDLVISEEKPVGNEDAFVYYDNSSFRFARPSGVSAANSYVIIAENDNEQVLASTENIRGVVKFNIPAVGRVLGLVSSNFMIVFIAMAGICLLLIIITAILFAKGRKRQLEAEDYSIDDEDDDYRSQQAVYDDDHVNSDDEPYFADNENDVQYEYEESGDYVVFEDSENPEEAYEQAESGSERVSSEHSVQHEPEQETVYELIDDDDE